MMQIADQALGLNHQALAVLQVLAGPQYEPAWLGDVRTRTYAWYNGRETGVCLKVQPDKPCFKGPFLYIIFGEHRSTDQLFVDTVESTADPHDAPRIEYLMTDYGDMDETRAFYEENDVRGAVNHIEQMIQLYARKMKRDAA